MELLEQWDAFTIHSTYYITKHLNAALQRCFSLAPHYADVEAWYNSCPKTRQRIHFWPLTRSGNSLMISSYFGSDICALCNAKCTVKSSSRTAVCSTCQENRVNAASQAIVRLREVQNQAHEVASKCRSCNLCWEDGSTFAQCRPSQKSKRRSTGLISKSSGGGVVTPLANCSCIDCPTTYERHRLREAELEAQSVCEALGLLKME